MKKLILATLLIIPAAGCRSTCDCPSRSYAPPIITAPPPGPAPTTALPPSVQP